MLRLDESAALAGGFRWCELALWRTASRWAATSSPPTVAVCLDVLAGHAAWRAAQWYDRMPVLASVDRDALVVASGPWAAMVAALDDDAWGGAERLAVVTRVLLGRLAADYAAVSARADGAGDGPVARTLAQAEADLAADWRRASVALTAALDDDEAVDAAAAAVSAVERHACRRPAGEAAK